MFTLTIDPEGSGKSFERDMFRFSIMNNLIDRFCQTCVISLLRRLKVWQWAIFLEGKLQWPVCPFSILVQMSKSKGGMWGGFVYWICVRTGTTELVPSHDEHASLYFLYVPKRKGAAWAIRSWGIIWKELPRRTILHSYSSMSTLHKYTYEPTRINISKSLIWTLVQTQTIKFY